MALGLLALLGACGGGSSDAPEPAPTPAPRVVIMGDSLSDSGTLAGRIFTITGSSTRRDVLWAERVATGLGAPPPCSALTSIDRENFLPNPELACTNFAVAGARVHRTGSPYGIVEQMRMAADRLSYAESDVVLLSAGGNDAADLIGAYLQYLQGEPQAYVALTSAIMGSEAVQAALAAPDGHMVLGGLYMRALAEHLLQGLRTHVDARGAGTVVLGNMPAVTDTPRFQAVLAQLADAQGAEAAAQLRRLFDAWVDAYNDTLDEAGLPEATLIVVDMAQWLRDAVAEPAREGFSNVTLPACGMPGLDEPVLRPLEEGCTAGALSAAPPPPGAPADPDWWRHFLFADGFHPTPYAHAQLAELVLELLVED